VARGGKKKKKSWQWPAAWALSSSRHFVVATALLGTAALLSLLEPYVWVGALIRELGFHLALLALLVALIAALRRAWLALGLLIAVALLFALPLLPLYRSTRPTPQAGPVLRVATAHLAGAKLPLAALSVWLTRVRPDALAITGLAESASFGARIGTYRVLRGSAELRTLLLVQNALVVPGRERSGAYPSQAVRAGRCQARLVAVELPPIAAYTTLDSRARGIAALTSLASAPRSIWFGHFGSRADAHDLAAFRAHHALRDGRLGHGRAATAPSALGALGFPLSHALVHGWISVREMSVGEPLVAGAQRTLSTTVELTEQRCRFTRGGTE
jgi:hypothetical protein